MRGNNEGSVYQRKDGRWAAAATVGGGRSSQQRKTLYGRTRKEVAGKLTDLQKSVKDGLPIQSDQLTVGAFAQEWLDTVKPPYRKPKTYQAYESAMRVHIVPSIGKVKLTKLEARHLAALISKLLEKGLSLESVRTYFRPIHTMLEKAVRLGLVPRNVASLVELPRLSKRDMPMLRASEVNRFLEEAKMSRLEALFALAITAGPRQGELLGLTWDNVDMESGEIKIMRALQRVDGQFVLTETKTKGSVRTIVLCDVALEALKRHQLGQLEDKLKAGRRWSNDHNLVFTSTIGTPLDRTNLRRMEFVPLKERSGLSPAFRFHDLRHVAASLALGQGMPIPLVAEMLGHANATTTLRVYAHVIPGSQRQVADAMNALLAS
jgi:integrase